MKRKRIDVGKLVLLAGFIIVVWVIDGINLSVQDYRLFSLFFDPLVGFWLFVLVVGAGILFLIVGHNRYWRSRCMGKLVVILFFGGVSVSIILLAFTVVFSLALPAYIASVQALPTQTDGVIERLNSTSSRSGGSYYMTVDDKTYHISQPWYYELDVGQELTFITVGEHAFPEGFVDQTFVGMMVTFLALVGWLFTLFLVAYGLAALFDGSFADVLRDI